MNYFFTFLKIVNIVKRISMRKDHNKFIRTTMRLFNAFFFSIFFHFVDVMFPFDCAINFQLILLDFVIEFTNFT